MISMEVMVADVCLLARNFSLPNQLQTHSNLSLNGMKNYVSLGILYIMIEHKNTSLQFGRVLIESGIIRTEIWIHDNENQSSYSCGTIDLPLDELPDLLRKEGIPPKAFAQDALKRAQPVLDREYPGGYQQAIEDLSSWLANH